MKLIYAVVEKRGVQFKFETPFQNLVENFMLMIGYTTRDYYLSLTSMKDYSIQDVTITKLTTVTKCQEEIINYKYELIY